MFPERQQLGNFYDMGPTFLAVMSGSKSDSVSIDVRLSKAIIAMDIQELF